ncbi:hypothetical protein KC19_1G113400 [Ceratodon purpureus]|uniref:ATP synthase F0 subunit 8 n=1 Tax=Ceratodon purpureus TaxID=3225 RepID=A0A8T0J728_CERPU|nr:hypothetical protein KC19_1G113400 [Ceratodon purpureus]
MWVVLFSFFWLVEVVASVLSSKCFLTELTHLVFPNFIFVAGQGVKLHCFGEIL